MTWDFIWHTILVIEGLALALFVALYIKRTWFND
jgi:hypothetical protein